MLTAINTAMVINKKVSKMENFSVLLTFLLITIAVLITVSIYSYVMHEKKKNISQNKNTYYHITTPVTS